MVLNILLYFGLAMYFDNVLDHNRGVGKSPLFLCQMCRKKNQKNMLNSKLKEKKSDTKLSLQNIYISNEINEYNGSRVND